VSTTGWPSFFLGEVGQNLPLRPLLLAYPIPSSPYLFCAQGGVVASGQCFTPPKNYQRADRARYREAGTVGNPAPGHILRRGRE